MNSAVKLRIGNIQPAWFSFSFSIGQYFRINRVIKIVSAVARVSLILFFRKLYVEIPPWFGGVILSTTYQGYAYNDEIVNSLLSHFFSYSISPTTSQPEDGAFQDRF